MRKYELTVWTENSDFPFEYGDCHKFTIEQEESSYPTTRWLAYKQAKEIVDKMESVQRYVLERML